MNTHRCFMVKNGMALYLLAAVCLTLISTPVAQCENDEVYKKLLIFSDVIGEIEENYVDPVKTDDLIEQAISGMVKGLDPHSAYLTPTEYTALTEDTKGEFSGIGVVLTIKDDILTVISPIEGTPASRAGIKAGDVIVKVNGDSAYEMSIDEAVNKIKGPKGTRLTLTILRIDESDPIDIDLERDDIPLESVRGMLLKEGYGYVSVSNFNDNTTRDLEYALNEMEAKDNGLYGLILDLRGNPGGLLDQSVSVADMFLSAGDVVSIKGREGGETQIWRAQSQENDRNYPLVVLVNGGSASASEIVAGALQDHKRALIVGTQSFGKGSVQNIKPLDDGSAIKLTVARYYTPSGRSIQAEGITPDIEIPFRRLKKAKKENTLKEKDLKNHLKAIIMGKDVTDADDDFDTGIISSDTITMRKKPDSSADSIKTLTKGSQVKVLKRMDAGWMKVSHGGDTGYIRGDESNVRLETDDSSLNEYGKLDREKLLLDSQVKQAMELLISHHIFSGTDDLDGTEIE